MKGLFGILIVVACVALFTPLHDVAVSAAVTLFGIDSAGLSAELLVDVAVLALVVLALLLEPVIPVAGKGVTEIRSTVREPYQARAPPVGGAPALGWA